MGFFSKVGAHLSAGRLAVLGTIAGFSAMAEDAAVTIPDVGVDLEGYASAAITSLGGVVAVVIGGTIAFILIRSGIRWIRGMK